MLFTAMAAIILEYDRIRLVQSFMIVTEAE